MRLAFTNQGRYPEFERGYDLYVKRSKTGNVMDIKSYKRVLRAYCKAMSEMLCKYGIVDLPCEIGSLSAAVLTRKPQYRGKTFIGYGKKDWTTGEYDGTLKTFGIVFLPRMKKHHNLRCFGFVANRRLFKKMKNIYISDDCTWYPVEFNDDMI